jgi:hypothetical protein
MSTAVKIRRWSELLTDRLRNVQVVVFSAVGRSWYDKENVSCPLNCLIGTLNNFGLTSTIDGSL